MGFEFLREVDYIVDRVESLAMSHEEWAQGDWCDLTIGQIQIAHCGAAGTVVTDISPETARQLRDGCGGAGGRLHFVLIKHEEFAILVEPPVRHHDLCAGHFAGFDFIGGRNRVYGDSSP